MKSVTTYLNLNGNCRQAMTFNQQCLGVELPLSPFPDEQGKPSTDPKAGIMHARLSRAGTPILMASDTLLTSRSRRITTEVGRHGSPVRRQGSSLFVTKTANGESRMR